MKKVIIGFLLVFIVISYQSVIFASYNSETLESELQTSVEQMFKERSKVWNGFLMGQYTSIDKIKMDLQEFITDPLLKSDVKMFNEMLNNPVSFEQIPKVSIQDISILKRNRDKATLEAVVLWTILDYEKEYDEEVKYIIKLEKLNDKWFLSDYEISE